MKTKLFFVTFLALVLFNSYSCKVIKESQSSKSTDTLVVYSKDTLIVNNVEKIYVDTNTQRWHREYFDSAGVKHIVDSCVSVIKNSMKTDNSKYQAVHDSIYLSSTDTLTITKTEIQEVKIKSGFDKFTNWWFWISLIIIIGAIAYYVIKFFIKK